MHDKPYSPFYSDRLKYSPIIESDQDDCLSYYMNDTCMFYITGKGMNSAEADAKFQNILDENKKYHDAGFFKVQLKHNQTFIGIAKFEISKEGEAEAGYGMLPHYWGKGYASEILDFLIGHTKRFPEIKELIGIINPTNSASKNVLVKNGFEWYQKGVEDEKPVEYYKLTLYT